LDHVVAFGAGRPLDADAAVVLPAVGRWDAPGRLDPAGIDVRGLLTARRPSVLVVASDGDRVVAAVADASNLAARSVHGVDPALGLVEIHGRLDVDASGAEVADWTEAVALAQLAVGHQLVGASRTALRLARDHALERIQFGRPIAQFQAVRHRLAETLLAVEAADAVLDAAWIDRSPVTAAMAKATAGRSARTAARHCQQVLAGIGFTTEHDLHRFVRRILVLDQLFGAHDTLTKQLGEELIRSRTLPPFVAL
jgi:acyl-CoA dehydrogenase-like protein